MATPSGPTWYDVLGVGRDASPTEIRAAWRAATDRAEPGTSQFRSYNDALDTLLDPQRRVAYDATLPAEAAPVATPPPAPAATTDGTTTDGTTTEPADVVSASAAVSTNSEDERTASRVPRWLPVALAVAVVLVAALAITLGVSATQRVSAADRVSSAREQAPVAAEQAAEAMLSYDYRKLPSDQARAEGYLTGAFRSEFTKNFELLAEQQDGSEGPAVQTKAVVKAQAVGSGVVDVSDDGRTARVLVFVNQTSEKQGADPQIFLNRVAMTMKERDGRWLVSDLRSY